MTPCDPVGTQTLCSGSVRGQPPPPSRRDGGEQTLGMECTQGFLLFGEGGGRPGPAHGGGEAATGPLAGISAHASFQEQHQQKTSGAILASVLEVRTVDQFPGWNYMDFSPASHKALPQRLPCGPVVYPLLWQLVPGRPGHQDADCNFITFPSTPHAHFCPYGFLVLGC